jgi:hypothetical protein
MLNGSSVGENRSTFEHIFDTAGTYVVRQNSSPVVAVATVTDSIPAYTACVPGSARASGGSSVSVVGGEILWSGQVISGIPVVIELAVEVQIAPVGTSIKNTAYVNDGASNVIPLAASSLHNPGYSLTINDGVLYTNNSTVDLHFSWNVDDQITHIKISNASRAEKRSLSLL